MATADDARFGQVEIDVADTAQQFPSVGSSTGGVVIRANIGNVGPVYLGSDATVDGLTGFELGPGEGIGLEILNLGKLWLFGPENNRISWAMVNA